MLDMIGSFFNHVLLYHSWELILINGCKGQGALSEELLEASKYYIRYDRELLVGFMTGGTVFHKDKLFRSVLEDITTLRCGNGEEAEVWGAVKG